MGVKGNDALRYFEQPGANRGQRVRLRGNREEPYAFTDVDQLIEDFWTGVDEWSKR